MEPAIRAAALTKRYRILGQREDPASSLVQAAARLAMRPFDHLRTALSAPSQDEVLWALREVSFDVAHGQIVGVVGKNGSGKSTLLKILSRITAPTAGSAEIRGRVASLLEVGTGFHPELTGRENVFMNGAILGMGSREIARKFDQIVAFAGDAVERMIDTPVKRYSSGMHVRLGFAVAAHLDPDVLLVDEVLAVGDAAFRERCMGQMDVARKEGRTVLVVSHGLEIVESLCATAIWLDEGVLRANGEAREVVRRYLCSVNSTARSTLLDRPEPVDRPLWFTTIEAVDLAGRAVGRVTVGAPLRLRLRFRCKPGTIVRGVQANIVVRDANGREVTRFWTPHQNLTFPEVPESGSIVCTIPRVPLAPGSYRLDLDTSVGGVLSDWVLAAGALEVVEGDFFGKGGKPHNYAVFLCEHEWALEPSHAPAAASS